MQHDRQCAEDTKGWLQKADADLRTARLIIQIDPSLTGSILFHCQQAVEKILKGFLTWHDTEFSKTHDLGNLGLRCARIDPSLETLLRQAESLTMFAWAFRYPGEPEEPSTTEVRDALSLTENIHKEILKRLPTDVHP
jgi:HEPN domain-containing protein